MMIHKEFLAKPAALYRHFNVDGELLYVGISVSSLVRLTKHRHASSWFSEIAVVKIEHFPNRPDALKAEAKAIREERPRHNLSKTGISRTSLKNWPFGESWVKGSIWCHPLMKWIEL
jgi:predicted GIY-YIG superfamily endonuclease